MTKYLFRVQCYDANTGERCDQYTCAYSEKQAVYFIYIRQKIKSDSLRYKFLGKHIHVYCMRRV